MNPTPVPLRILFAAVAFTMLVTAICLIQTGHVILPALLLILAAHYKEI